ncbi:hypothetical protein [Sphingosinicella sp.]|uniref:hypothetical protein n=1 Tax=Sphingosinicella sp. TaxID=1917971 RepID=UPI002613C8DD|nr:hypothetical protein [Sphingosinicella sp.]
MPITSPSRSRHFEPLTPKGVGNRADALLFDLSGVHMTHCIPEQCSGKRLQGVGFRDIE